MAGKEGQVVEITAEEGRAEVKVGDVVTKGQLLISGLYEQVPDPYGPQPNIRYQRAGASRGSVVAETYREFTVTVGATAEVLQPQGEPQRQLYLELFGLRLPLGLWTAPPQDSLVWEERTPVKALGTELPLAWNVRTVQPRTRQVAGPHGGGAAGQGLAVPAGRAEGTAAARGADPGGGAGVWIL